MLNQFSRTQLLLGPDAMESLYGKKVAVFGIGGVGGYSRKHGFCTGCSRTFDRRRNSKGFVWKWKNWSVIS